MKMVAICSKNFLLYPILCLEMSLFYQSDMHMYLKLWISVYICVHVFGDSLKRVLFFFFIVNLLHCMFMYFFFSQGLFKNLIYKTEWAVLILYLLEKIARLLKKCRPLSFVPNAIF